MTFSIQERAEQLQKVLSGLSTAECSVILFAEDLRVIKVLNQSVHRYLVEEDVGEWIAAVTITQGIFSSAIPYEKHRIEEKGIEFKISCMPYAMSGQATFCETVNLCINLCEKKKKD